ncbi:M3 family metallopeptidase [Nocardioides sp.]|uniref:M3 family metallopeptidase n=1 Tax=Nocardioides sp. TaxID=35761 RepID=UPI0027325FBD|nr:M3 family metallopeptidase [Nocardioides sp.]MDP3891774.1 M3 family metallopeptidase [Nocardioides sp.]
MTASTPAPAPQDLPAVDGDWAAWLRTRCDDRVAEAGRLAARLRSTTPGDGAVLELLNDLSIELSGAFAVASLVSQVHPDAALREQAEQAESVAHRFRTDLLLDAEVQAVIAAVPADGLDAPARRLLEHTLRDFRRSGVDRDEETRDRLRVIAERENELEQAFARGIRDGRRVTRVPVTATEGLPQDWVDEHPPGEDGLVEVSTESPDTVPFVTFSRDAGARREVMQTYLDVGWPGNDPVLVELLALRHEHATLLGYADWPDYDAEVKMIGSGAEIGVFIDRITAAADGSGRRDLAVLLEAKRADDPQATSVDLSDWRHYTERHAVEAYGVDAQQVRRYFDFTRVRAGLLEVTGRLFGLEYTPVEDAGSWHDEVTAYDVALDGERIGRIRLDLHPREGKYNHAAQFTLVDGVAGRQLPEGVLVCNFPRGLMEHRDVVTLFHEFGHLMHHVLAGRQRWVRFSGVATEWDFVEAPSQMLEEWAWDAEVLRSFATDSDGEPIPEDLVARMRAADEFGKGFLARTQMFYAAVSWRLHTERPVDLTARIAELYDEFHLLTPLPDTHFHTSFGHLVGYTSAYYTYMWSLVIAKDLFSAFDPDDLFATEVAHRYRDRVLVPGGSADAADLVEGFLGRPYETTAFRAWLDARSETTIGSLEP